MLAMTYSPFKKSTIGAKKLNFRVRNENGCTLLANSPTLNLQKIQMLFLSYDQVAKLVPDLNTVKRYLRKEVW